jgi:hypothetical protein
MGFEKAAAAVFAAAGAVSVAGGVAVAGGLSTWAVVFPFSADLGRLPFAGMVFLLQEANTSNTGMINKYSFFMLLFDFSKGTEYRAVNGFN